MLFPGNDFLEDSPYEPVNSRLSDIFRLAPILGKSNKKRAPCPFGGSHSTLQYLLLSLFHWSPVSVEIAPSCACSLSEGYLCVWVFILPHPLRYLSFSPRFLSQRYCMLAGSDLARGAIVLSLTQQWVKEEGSVLLVLFFCCGLERCSFSWQFESTCWKRVWVRSCVSNVGEHDRHFSVQSCVWEQCWLKPLDGDVIPFFTATHGCSVIAMVETCGYLWMWRSHVAAYIVIITLQVMSAVSDQTDTFCLHVSK